MPRLIFVLVLFLTIKNSAFSQTYSAEVVNYSTTLEADFHRISQVDSVTIQINNRAGDQYAAIEIPYSKTEKISSLSAWIENMDGSKIKSLKKSDVVDKSAISDISLYEDHFVKEFELKHNSNPYRVVYTFKTSMEDYMTIASWSPVIDHTIPTNNAKLTVILPKELHYTKLAENIAESKIDTSKSSVILEWRTSYKKPVKNEIFSQPQKEIPTVLISPEIFKYGVQGSMKTWESFSNWEYRLIKGLDILPDNEKFTISTLINGLTDKREIVKTLYHYLQDHTRYINVSIGIGGYKPYPASYVAEKKYGDCKALSNYMKALLNIAGIESYYCNVYASDQPLPLNRNFPSPQFNHAILAIPLERDTIWLDNTSGTCPFGYLGTFTQNREALLIKENGGLIVKTPLMKKEDTHTSFKLLFDIGIEGQAKVNVNDESLLKLLYAWSKEKQKYSEAKALEAIHWMNENNVVPGR